MDDRSNRGLRLKRRELLQVGLGGAAAALASGPLVSGAQTPGSGQGRQAPVPPSPATVTDVAALRVEDWSEPWVWRPSEWPDQPLDLNVVGHAHPPQRQRRC